jgi:hypothetical protein
VRGFVLAGSGGSRRPIARLLKLDGAPRDLSRRSAMLGRMRNPMDEVSMKPW